MRISKVIRKINKGVTLACTLFVLLVKPQARQLPQLVIKFLTPNGDLCKNGLVCNLVYKFWRLRYRIDGRGKNRASLSKTEDICLILYYDKKHWFSFLISYVSVYFASKKARVVVVCDFIVQRPYPFLFSLKLFDFGNKAKILDLRTPVEACTFSNATMNVWVDNGFVLDRNTIPVLCSLKEKVRQKKVVYFDYDHFSILKGFHSPVFKPDYSPLYNSSINMLDGLLVCSKDIVDRKIRSIRDRTHFKNDEHFVNAEVEHFPVIIQHKIGKKSRIKSIARMALCDVDGPSVSIIIPTKDNYFYISKCVESISEKTNYDNYEIVVVDNGSTKPLARKYLDGVARDHKKIKVLEYAQAFNYAKINNYAVKHSNSDIIIFLNDDTEVLDGDWLRKMVFAANNESIGVVGARLLYPDRTIQHVGVVLGVAGAAGHFAVGLDSRDSAYMGIDIVNREVSAVTGACLAVRHEVFCKLGGFCEDIKVAFSDIEFCVRATQQGLTNIQLNEVDLIHHESKSRGYSTTIDSRLFENYERIQFLEKCGNIVADDPFYNDNLSFRKGYCLSFPPRVEISLLEKRQHKKRILMLSSTHAMGHGVAVVVCIQANYLASTGFDVYVAGPRSSNEVDYIGCRRVELATAEMAADFAIVNRIDCIIAHTPPFFGITQLLPKSMKTIIYDYGEPPVELFANAKERELVNLEKRASLFFATRVLTISKAIKDELSFPGSSVLFLGNSHLLIKESEYGSRRNSTRTTNNWDDKIVVLCVTRFHKQERYYKGINMFIRLARKMSSSDDKDYVFVLVGKANDEDRDYVEQFGIKTFTNVSDNCLIDLYSAADIYVTFSQWEGFNLGLAQAVANGLPSIASKIPVHREFPAILVENEDDAVQEIERIPKYKRNEKFILDWSVHNEKLKNIIIETINNP
jgi:GT2 family glycosyltransferase